MTNRTNYGFRRALSLRPILLCGIALACAGSVAVAQTRSETPVRPAGNEGPQREGTSSGLEELRPDEPIDLTLELLLRQTDTTLPVFTKRPLPEQPPLTTQELTSINPQSREQEIAIPLRGYPSPDEPPVPNRPLYAEASLGLDLTTMLRAGLSGSAWPFDYHAALEYGASQGFVENGESNRFGAEIEAGYVIGLDYGIFSGGYMGGGAHFVREGYRLYAVPTAPERALTDWGLSANGTAAYAGVDFAGTALLRRAELAEDPEGNAPVGTTATDLTETSVEGKLTAKASAAGLLGWGGAAEARLTSTSEGSINYGQFELFGELDAAILRLRAGGALSSGSASDGETYSRISPRVELRLIPTEGLALTAALTGGVSQTSVKEIVDVNRYVRIVDPLIRPEDEAMGYAATLRIEPSKKWGLRVAASRKTYDAYLFFGPPDQGRFAPQYDEARVDLLESDLFLQLDERNEFMAILRFSEGTIGATSRALPYVPKWDAEGRYTHAFAGTPLTLSSTLRFIGARHGGTGAVLDEAILLGIEGSYGVASFLDVTLDVRNLLNTRYELWEGYRERGLFVAVGARARM